MSIRRNKKIIAITLMVAVIWVKVAIASMEAVIGKMIIGKIIGERKCNTPIKINLVFSNNFSLQKWLRSF
jgi:hypothetical protein